MYSKQSKGLGLVVLFCALAPVCIAEERISETTGDDTDSPKCEFVSAFAYSDGGTLSVILNASGKRIIFCVTPNDPRFPWGSNCIYEGAGHPTDKKARLVKQGSPEVDQLIRHLESAMAPHRTMAATQARKQAIAQSGKDGIPPLPPGGKGPYGVEFAISTLGRLHAIKKMHQKLESDDSSQQ